MSAAAAISFEWTDVIDSHWIDANKDGYRCRVAWGCNAEDVGRVAYKRAWLRTPKV